MMLSVLERVRWCIQGGGKGEAVKLLELPCQLQLAMRAAKGQPAQILTSLMKRAWGLR